ncbi:MAG: HEAT repeat domain-containing protein [Ignavibacteriaceae bacterium]|jgi:HEAT repeat protein|nr:HEAT repeat domain-containing protein [Ignavibacteriaceae bacterium]
MSKQKLKRTDIKSLLDLLADKDGVIRKKARKALVAMGKIVVPSLTRVLRNSKLDHLRWEAAKTLGAIGDVRAISSLVKALEDRDIDVAWVAAEVLRKFKKEAWPALFRELIKSKPDSISLRQGVHHVLLNQKEDGLNDLLETLMKSLKFGTSPESASVAAYAILQRMKVN